MDIYFNASRFNNLPEQSARALATELIYKISRGGTSLVGDIKICEPIGPEGSKPIPTLADFFFQTRAGIILNSRVYPRFRRPPPLLTGSRLIIQSFRRDIACTPCKGRSVHTRGVCCVICCEYNILERGPGGLELISGICNPPLEGGREEGGG